jgi:hypothetical protein
MFLNLYPYGHEFCTCVMVGGSVRGGVHPHHQHLATTHQGCTPHPLNTIRTCVRTAPTQITIAYYTQWSIYRHFNICIS